MSLANRKCFVSISSKQWLMACKSEKLGDCRKRIIVIFNDEHSHNSLW
jgi:hypothetical protein